MEREPNSISLALGEKAPYFNLRGTDNKIYCITDFAEARALVVCFLSNYCPYCISYDERLVGLAQKYKEQGLSFVAICSNDPVGFPEDSFEKMIEKSQQLGFAFPYLQDDKQEAAKAYDAECTPEVYLFDSEQKLAYHGRIDDNFREPKAVESHDLRDAIEAVLAGEKPRAALTPVVGCSIKWK